jgi:benzylsuccinate CoA-transferase BbsF subunit
MKKAFEGTKVAEFAWAIVGPMTSRYLAEHGATVIKVESHSRLDVTKVTTPFAHGQVELDGSGYYARHNSNKYSVSIDLNHPNARKLAWKLIEWADIVTESFSPGTMEKWGLDYHSVSKIKPDVIYLSSSMQGRGGPHESFAGYGMNATSLCGFGMISGWPDRKPAAPYGAYTDYLAHRFNMAALIAALEYRERTGQGQWIEQSQFESSLQMFSSPIMDYQINGRILNRNGNRLDNAAPHGVYQCQGDDRWIAIAILTEEEWQAFKQAMNNPDWAEHERFSTLSLRKQNEDDIDRLITGWTLSLSVDQIDGILQKAGIACNMVEKSSDIYQDSQIAHRRRFTRLNHPVMGEFDFETQPCFILSKTPREISKPSPCLGQHNEYVFKELLGLSDDDFADHIADGSITTRLTREFKVSM